MRFSEFLCVFKSMMLIFLLSIITLFIPLSGQTQLIITQCQSQNDALIGTDRNDWAHANLAVVNQGYLHNFESIEVPCGLSALTLSQLDIEISINNINTSLACNGIPIFGNVLLNCPLTSNSICPIVQDVLSAGCTFGTGVTTTGNYTLNLNACGINPNSFDIIGVDIIPATENLASCPNVPDAIQAGLVQIEYEICITYTFLENIPDVCDNTISLPCDDGDPCTENDQLIVDECDNSEICIPCAGILLSDCVNTEIVNCDDGDPCTVNDVQVVSACDNTFICEPCQGTEQIDCDQVIELPCNDGDSCTENDIEIVSACDNNFICEPCAGTAFDPCTNTQAMACDDGNPCTVDDVFLIDLCNNNEICVPCMGTPITPIQCDDGNCSNGIEFWDETNCRCDTLASILGCTDPMACNFAPEATCDFDCDYLCLDCNGIPFGTAMLDSCGACLEPNDPLFGFSCFIDLYLPNAISPNADGLNDCFELNTELEFAFFEISIFNRLGQEIFRSDNPKFSWCGNGIREEYYLPTDIYLYVLSYTRNGPEIEVLKGHVAIIR